MKLLLNNYNQKSWLRFAPRLRPSVCCGRRNNHAPAMPVIFLTILLMGIFIGVMPVSGALKQKDSNRSVFVKSIEIKGNKVFSDFRLKLRMKIWSSSLLPGRMSSLNRKWLNMDIKNLVKFYREKGYPDVIVKSVVMHLKDRDTGEGQGVIVQININEGLKYLLGFTGNTFFSKGDLKKEIKLFKKGNIRDSALRQGRVNIERLYKKAGFEDVEVSFKKDKIRKKDGPGIFDRDMWQVTYSINQGKRMVVSLLTITGNIKLEHKEITDAMLIREKTLFGKQGFNLSTLKKDINAIELLYLSRGFLTAQISKQIRIEPDLEKKQEESVQELVYIDLMINEGEQTLVTSSGITGLGKIITEKKVFQAVTLRQGEPFREYMVKSDANAIGVLISEKGYPHVKVTGSFKLNADKTCADITWDVEPGTFTRVGKIRYSGNPRLKQRIIEKKLKIDTGSSFSLKAIGAAEKRIRSIGSVESVRIKACALKEKNEFVDLEVAVKEKKPYFVEAAAGFDTEREVYFKAKTGDINFLGRDIDFWVGGEVSKIGYRAETGVKNPLFMERDIFAKGTIYVEKEEELNQEFGTNSWGVSIGFSKPFFSKFMAGLNFKYENRSRYGGEEAGGTEFATEFKTDEDQFKTRNLLVTSTTLMYDARDAAISPSKGIFSSASVDLYTGFDSDLDRFVQYKLDIRKYYSPFKRVTFAFLGRLGYIEPFGSSSSVAEDQLFFLGGISDVRGFKENMLVYDENNDPVGGRSSICGSVEARIDIIAGFELTCFIDTGKIDQTESEMIAQGFRTSLGAGIRYMTPIGPVGLLYGYKLDPEENESRGRIHFAIGYTF